MDHACDFLVRRPPRMFEFAELGTSLASHHDERSRLYLVPPKSDENETRIGHAISAAQRKHPSYAVLPPMRGVLGRIVHVNISTDPSESAKAFLLARFGQDIFGMIDWIGSFQDQRGTYSVYLTQQYAPAETQGLGILKRYQDELLRHLRDFSTPLTFWNEIRADPRMAVHGVRRGRQLHELLVNLKAFQDDTNLLDLTDFSLDWLLHDPDENNGYFLDFRKVVKPLSPKQIANIHTLRARPIIRQPEPRP